ncbi:LAFA_0E15434g1_1 [Lachancea sp. 'fantastica']|nr:LAFA_0E15434g1_1 [Lachancea sp. 'fantastica']
MGSHESRSSTTKRSRSIEDGEQEKEEEEDYMTMVLPNENSVREAPEPRVKLRKVDTKQEEASEILPRGFAMMTKMGFSLGEGLGRDTKNAIKDPIWVSRHSSPIGTKTLQEPPSPIRKEEDVHEESYQKWVQEKGQHTAEMRTLHAMQKKAFELSGDVDLYSSKSDPRDFNCLWRRYVIGLQQKLRPRKQTEDVEQQTEVVDSPEKDDRDDELSMFEELTPLQQIRGVHVHMRTEFFYCFYCGAQFATEEELLQKCPGPVKEDHY